MRVHLFTPQDDAPHTMPNAAPIHKVWAESGKVWAPGFQVNARAFGLNEAGEMVSISPELMTPEWMDAYIARLPGIIDDRVPVDTPEGTYVYLDFEPTDPFNRGSLWRSTHTYMDIPMWGAFAYRVMTELRRLRPDLVWSMWGYPVLWDLGVKPPLWSRYTENLAVHGFFKAFQWVMPSITWPNHIGESVDGHKITPSGMTVRIIQGVVECRKLHPKVIPSIYLSPRGRWQPEEDLKMMFYALDRVVDDVALWFSVRNAGDVTGLVHYTRDMLLPAIGHYLDDA